MKNLLGILFFLFFVFCSYSTKAQEVHLDTIFTVVDKMPEPTEGYANFYKYLSENIYYTQKALERKIQGYVFVQFVVDEKGILTNPKILKGLGFGLDEEVLRVFANSPPWQAGEQDSKNVKVKMTFSIIFKLPK
ncbi:MAG: energy transducer TonB [Cytophagales bacterium]|nr:energy transducer TonB [Cytophagales bacterium]